MNEIVTNTVNCKSGFKAAAVSDATNRLWMKQIGEALHTAPIKILENYNIWESANYSNRSFQSDCSTVERIEQVYLETEREPKETMTMWTSTI